MHFLDRHDSIDRTERAAHILEPRRRGLGRLAEEDAFGPLLDDQFGAGAPAAPFPNRLGQDHLPLGRDLRFEGCGLRHGSLRVFW